MTAEEQKTKNRERARRYYWRNAELLRKKAREWRTKNPERRHAALLSYKKTHPERIAATQAAYRATHRNSRNERKRAKYAANPKPAREYAAKRYQKLAVLLRAVGRARYAANAAREIARALEYEKNNRAKVTAIQARRNAAKLRATPSWANRFFIEEAYSLAALRTKMLGFAWHVDHIVPLQHPKVCGLHTHTNLQVIPGSENCRKQNRYWPDQVEAI